MKYYNWALLGFLTLAITPLSYAMHGEVSFCNRTSEAFNPKVTGTIISEMPQVLPPGACHAVRLNLSSEGTMIVDLNPNTQFRINVQKDFSVNKLQNDYKFNCEIMNAESGPGTKRISVTCRNKGGQRR